MFYFCSEWCVLIFLLCLLFFFFFAFVVVPACLGGPTVGGVALFAGRGARLFFLAMVWALTWRVCTSGGGMSVVAARAGRAVGDRRHGTDYFCEQWAPWEALCFFSLFFPSAPSYRPLVTLTVLAFPNFPPWILLLSFTVAGRCLRTSVFLFHDVGSKNMLYPVEDHALRRQTGQRKLTFVCRTCGNKEAMSPETLAKPVYKNVVTHTEKCVARGTCGVPSVLAVWVSRCGIYRLRFCSALGCLSWCLRSFR